MEDPLKLEAILNWNMTPAEGEAFQLTIYYEQVFRELFGTEIDGQTYRRNSLPKKGDPRKSVLFRHCWKMRRETRGLLELHEYKNYIHANLFIIKINNGQVLPNCVCGDKAWIRYKVWKRKYDQKMADVSATTPLPSVSTTNPKIIAEIDRTKKFLFERCDGEVTLEKIGNFIKKGLFKLWIASGKVSAYYVALSPFVANSCDISQLFSVCMSSLSVVQEKLTPEVRNYFRHEYHFEFI